MGTSSASVAAAAPPSAPHCSSPRLATRAATSSPVTSSASGATMPGVAAAVNPMYVRFPNAHAMMATSQVARDELARGTHLVVPSKAITRIMRSKPMVLMFP